MAWVAVAGIAVTAIGAGVSAYGAKKNAEAIGAANASNAQNEDLLYQRQSENLDDLIKSKNRKLKNIGNIFDRFKSTGAFGDTNTLENLRKAQEDFSQLAAGNFTSFEDQLKQNMSDALINTVGSGSPVGSYAELAANTQLAMRGQGIQTAVGVSEFLSNESNKLLGAEFGIMDQRFNTDYQMDRARVSNVANYRLGKAATEGMGTVAMGNAGMQIGSAITSYGIGQQTMGIQKDYLKIAQDQANKQNTVANRAPATSSYVMPQYDPVRVPDFGSTTSGQSNSSTLYPKASLVPSGEIRSWYSNNPNSPTFQRTSFDQQQYDDYGMVLPPLSYNNQPSSSILSSIGASVVRS